jgi:O-antigen/teichoic acid export membrane protein
VGTLEENRQSSIIRDAKWVGGSLYLAKLLGLPCSILTANLLGPFLFGTWRALGLIQTYAPFLQLGIFSGLLREVPFSRGKGETNKVLAYQETGFTVSLLAAGAGTMVLFVASWVLQGHYSPLVLNGIRVMAVVVFFQHLYAFYDYLLRAEQDFLLASRAKIFYSAGGSILQVIGVLLYGINGLFLSVILINIGIALYLCRKVPIRLRVPRFGIIVGLMRSGIPMLLNGMADTLFYTVDRVIILAFLGREELGYYAIALLAASFVEFVPATFQLVLLPRITRQAGNSGSPGELSEFWLEPLYILAYVLPVMIGLGWLLAPIALVLLLPQYLPGLFAMKILMIGMCFAAIPTLTRNVFIAANKQFRVLGVFLIMGALALGLNYIFVKLGWGITGIALATSLSFLFFGILLISMALSLQGQIRELLNVMVRLYSPALAIAAILAALDFFIPWSTNIRDEIINTAIKLGTYTVLILPLMYFFDRQTHLVSKFFIQTWRTVT